MLEKFIKISNVGKFVDYEAEGKVNLNKVTLIYGENGRGKTTLAAILRSLASQDSDHILARKTAGPSQNKTSVQIRVKGISKTVCFRDGHGWDAHVPGIEIFDSNFVNDNVYSGSDVSHEHRKNLYYFVVGEEGVNLAKKIDELDERVKKLKNKIVEKGAEIEKLVEWKGEIEKFVALTPVQDLDSKIKMLRARIEILEQADAIKKRGTLKILDVNALAVAEIELLLARKIEDLLASAEIQVKRHIEHCMDENGEGWLQNGLAYVIDEKCPFCGQVVDGLSLIQSYKGYFSDSYSKLKQEILDINTKIKEFFSEDILLGLQKVFGDNLTLVEDWQTSGLILQGTTINQEEFIKLWKETRNGWLGLISSKNERPLDDIDNKEIELSQKNYEKFIKAIETYNLWIRACNEKIDEFKAQVDDGNLENDYKLLKILDATKKRFSSIVDGLCQEYQTLIMNRDSADTDKKKTKKELEQFDKDVFGKYQLTINDYLQKFGVGFRLGKITTGFSGGKASTSYGLLLNEVAVKLSAGEKSEPSFKSGASEGDKSSLAFAFFLAKLEHDKDIANKIIVFDDPITSLDMHRKNCTKDEIIKVIKKAKQVIILSHDLDFLRILWDSYPSTEIQTLHVQRKGKDNSTLSQWDIAEATRGDYYSDYFTLLNYLEKNEGDSRLVVRAIRPLLEGYYRVRFPREFPANKWLGDFIEIIRKAESTEAISTLQKVLSEIVDINNYSKKYHHKENPNADKEAINDGELTGYIERTIKLISG